MLSFILDIPNRIFRFIAFMASVVLCTAIHYVLALPLHLGSYAILFNAHVSRRLMAFALDIPFKEFDTEIMSAIRDRNKRNNDPS
ncbi:unnamed protein product [marine sediment metagenome]|uniref:Uncharacterized protein n=1 Tax=marine sediment metagenome TaxID=412755 RepID=X0Y1E2_9ZZZZ